MAKDKPEKNGKKKTLSKYFTKRLLLIFLVTYLSAGFIAFFVKAQIRYNDYLGFMSSDIDYLRMSAVLGLFEKFDALTNMIMAETDDEEDLSRLEDRTDAFSYCRLFLLDRNDRVVYSNVPGMEGQDLSSLNIIKKINIRVDMDTTTNKYVTYLVDEGMLIGDNDQSNGYLAGYYNNRDNQDGVMLIGVDKELEYRLKKESVYNNFIEYVDDGSFQYVLSDDGTILTSQSGLDSGLNISTVGIRIDPGKEYEYSVERFLIDGKIVIFMIDYYDGLYFLSGTTVRNLLAPILENTASNVFVIGLCFIVLFIILRFLVRKGIIDRLMAVNLSLNKITDGNLEEKVNVRDFAEFEELSDDVNHMVDNLKALIAKEAARIDQDLEIAEEIQKSSLPSVFPPFPEHKEFELFASMKAAKTVGGDFYDYYMIDSNTLGFLIADVSGKSIPGAMFMMRSKSVIKALAEEKLPPHEVFTRANDSLCKDNVANMFVTAWMGYLDLTTGVLRAVNAGHNPPVLIRDGKAQFLKIMRKYVLAGMEDTFYMEQQVQLKEGDILFLYTDGVTEGNNPTDEMYGEDRLKTLLSFGKDYPEATDENGTAGAVCRLVSEDLDRFTEGAEQFDDITMLCLKYKGNADGG